MRIDAKLQRELEGVSAKEAAEIICNEFGRGEHLFTYALTERASTPKRVMEQKGVAGISAEEISPICFYGGPPGNRKFYRGTLLTWLCDLILFSWATEGNYADMVIDGDKFQTA
jgi:hypothetical protein